MRGMTSSMRATEGHTTGADWLVSEGSGSSSMSGMLSVKFGLSLIVKNWKKNTRC